VVPVLTFDPSHQKSVSYEDQEVRTTLVLGQGVTSLKIIKRSTGEEKLVELPAEMTQVDEIRKGVGNKLAVRGMVNGSSSEIVVVDLGSDKVIDKFVCYLPSLSRDVRYIAFIKFYPSHFAEGTEDHYMLYDLAKTPAENRPRTTPSGDWKTVGRCIYPMGIGNDDNDNVGHPKDREHFSRSQLFWSQDQEQFFFADQVDSAPQIVLVLVDVSADGGAKVRTLTQGTEQMCSANSVGTGGCAAIVRKVEFRSGAEAIIAVTFEIISNRQQRTIAYKPQQFQ